MSFVTVNGARVYEGSIVRPFSGVWHADLAVEADAAPTGRVSISVADGALVLAGTAFRTGSFADRVRLRVVGGAGGIGTVIVPAWYRDVPARIVLSDALSAVGEQLATTTDPAALSMRLAQWARARGEAS
jgi:hypothetical protein